MLDKLLFLPPAVVSALKKLDWQKLQEIRIRADKPISVLINGRFLQLFECGASGYAAGETGAVHGGVNAGYSGVSSGVNGAAGRKVLKCSAAEIAQIVLRAAEFSIYAFNSQISAGYLTIAGGIRIGVAGEVVYDSITGAVKTQKNYGSLVLRIPHEIVGCADRAYRSISGARNKNTLIISPPGAGKTTLLRDLCRQISDAGHNTLLVDERNELAACMGGLARLNVGQNTDIVNNAQKDYAFSFGIRSLRPDYIITDELGGADDIAAVLRAASSGVKVVASVHAADISELKRRAEFLAAFDSKVFGRFVVLSLTRGAGTYEKILDSELNAV